MEVPPRLGRVRSHQDAQRILLRPISRELPHTPAMWIVIARRGEGGAITLHIAGDASPRCDVDPKSRGVEGERAVLLLLISRGKPHSPAMWMVIVGGERGTLLIPIWQGDASHPSDVARSSQGGRGGPITSHMAGCASPSCYMGINSILSPLGY